MSHLPMKILFVAHLTPLPCSSGNRARILSLIREIVGFGHEVHYAFLNATRHPADCVRELQIQLGGGRFHEVKIRGPEKLESRSMRGLRKMLRMIGHEAGHRVALDHRYDPGASVQLELLHKQHRFDAVFVEYVFMSKAFEAFTADTLRVLDTHDAFGDRHRVFLQAKRKPSWYATTLAEEEAGFRRADAVVAIQEAEAEDFRRRLGAEGDRVHTVSHIVDLSRRVHLPTVSAAGFIGAVNAVNMAALEFLVGDILPRIRKRRPGFKLLVAGPISSRIDEADGVESCGLVDHVADLYARAPILLNAMTLGTGINIKLLEAMACGVPSVTTEIGARGLAEEFRHGIRTVPDGEPGAFADAVLELLGDDDVCHRIGEMAFTDAVAWNEKQRHALRGVLQLARGQADAVRAVG